MYPNPVEEEFTIVNNSGNPVSYKIYNIMGQLIKQGTNDLEKFNVHIENTSGGIYFINMEDTVTKGKFSNKLIIK